MWENVYLIYLLIFVVIPAKVLMWKMIEEVDTRKLFGYGIGLFLTYIAMMFFLLWFMCRDAVSAQDCLQRAMVTLLLGNVIALFAMILCYCLRGKRGISEIDRMKLKDM